MSSHTLESSWFQKESGGRGRRESGEFGLMMMRILDFDLCGVVGTSSLCSSMMSSAPSLLGTIGVVGVSSKISNTSVGREMRGEVKSSGSTNGEYATRCDGSWENVISH